jgi:hypothetical protein
MELAPGRVFQVEVLARTATTQVKSPFSYSVCHLRAAETFRLMVNKTLLPRIYGFQTVNSSKVGIVPRVVELGGQSVAG